jgi:hypothetical protein
MLKIFVSDHTYRTEAEQLEKLRKDPRLADAPVFRPVDLPTMFRATQRATSDTFCAASVACFGKTDDGFVAFLENCRQRKASIFGAEEKFSWRPGQSIAGAVKAWKLARVKGAAKAGADISAKRRNSEREKGCKAIKPFWGLPTKNHPTADLLRQANKAIGKRGKMHYRTAVKFLGSRLIARNNHRAAQKRAEQKARAA